MCRGCRARNRVVDWSATIDQMNQNVTEILTFKECQHLLKVGKNTLLRLLHSGEIEAFRIGNRWKIPKIAVYDFICYQ